MDLNKSQLQDRYSLLLQQQLEKVKQYTALRDDADRSLALLMQEIATNKNTPPEIFELAKSFVQKQQLQFDAGVEFSQIVEQIAQVGNDLYPKS